ncbi:MAG: MarC family protein [Verrucomicrobiales bacterium]
MESPSLFSSAVLLLLIIVRWFGALAVAMGLSTILLWWSPRFYAKLGPALTNAIERLVGMILIMLSVQMLLDGIETYLNR